MPRNLQHKHISLGNVALAGCNMSAFAGGAALLYEGGVATAEEQSIGS